MNNGVAWGTVTDNVDLIDDAHINDMRLYKFDVDGDIPLTGCMQWKKGTDVASAATLAPTYNGNYFDVTGTTSITAINQNDIGGDNVQAGTPLLLQFDGILKIVHDGDNIVIPGGLDIQTNAGDHVLLVSYATDKWRVVKHETPRNSTLQNLLSNSGFGVWSQSDTNKGIGSLTYDNLAVSTFSVGETITGQTSGAVGKMISLTGLTLSLGACAGRFQDNEQILGGTSGATADVNMPNSAAGVDLVQNGDFSVDTDPPPGWTLVGTTTLTTEAGGQVGNCMKMVVAGPGEGVYQAITVEAGKIYKLTYYYNNTAGDVAQWGIYDVTNATWIKAIADLADSPGAWSSAQTFTLEAPSGCTQVRLYFLGKANTDVLYYDEISLYEITPCCTAADSVAMDGWEKYNHASSPNVYRQHNDSTYTKDGSFYSLKIVPRIAYSYNVMQLGVATYSLTENLAKYQGRTVTFGAWVLTNKASHAYLNLRDGVAADSVSPAHSGGGSWEWLEVTKTIDASATRAALCSIKTGQTGETGGDTIIYFSQPMLVFGSSIGESNFSSPSQEVIRFEKDIVLNDYDGGVGDIGADVDAELNIEVQSNAMIPKGIAEMYCNIRAMDSVVAAGVGVWLGPDTTYCASGVGDVGLVLHGLGNDVVGQAAGWVRCDSGGDPWLFINESGANTLDCEIRVQGVRLR